MTERDRERWDERYRTAGQSVDPCEPSALFGRYELLPTPGRALDVACGRGAVTLWLAQRGWTVDAVDVSGVGLQALAQSARAAGTAARVRTWCRDLDDGLPSPLEGGFSLVVCQRFRDPRLYRALGRALVPGGLLLLSELSEVGGESGPFRASAGELLTAFAGFDVLAHREGDGEAALLARAPTG